MSPKLSKAQKRAAEACKTNEQKRKQNVRARRRRLRLSQRSRNHEAMIAAEAERARIREQKRIEAEERHAAQRALIHKLAQEGREAKQKSDWEASQEAHLP